MKIYAHRGASRDFPEMSREAYLEAVIQGADGFECDLRLTKDRQLICWHDSNTLRMTGIKKNISRTNFKDLAFAKPLLLSELIEIAEKNRKALAIETKHPVLTSGAVERELIRLLNELKPTIDISIMSFSKFAINRIPKTFKGVNLIKFKLEKYFNSASVIGPSLALIKAHPEIVSDAHSKGRAVYIWTVNNPEDVKYCAEIGVDVIMSDIPAQARRALGYS
jgi:glycerophosphoryl diester phosphodiesterase